MITIDMEMPKRCLECPMYDNYNYYCTLYSFGIPARYNQDGSTRPEWCELEELPSTPPDTDEWCRDYCSEYDSEKHCCPRFNRVIRTALDEVVSQIKWERDMAIQQLKYLGYSLGEKMEE